MPLRLFTICLFLVFMVFVCEVTMPFQVWWQLGYVIVIFYMLQYPQQTRYAILLGIITSMLIATGYIISLQWSESVQDFPIERGLSLLAIWLGVYFSIRFKAQLDREIKQREQLNAVFNNATEGMLIVNEQGEIVLVNIYAQLMFGYNEGELVDRSVEELLPAGLRSAHRQHRQGFMSSPQSRPMGVGRELTAKRKDGSEFPVEVSLSYFRSEEGPFAIAFVLDMTERKKAREKLIEEKILAQSYFELAPVLFVVLDTKGHVISVNDYGCQHLGYSKDAVMGRHFTEFMPEDGRIDALGRFDRLLDGSSNEFQNESIVRNSRGEEVEMSWRKTAIRDKDGVAVAVLSAGIDITEKKRQEKLTILHHAAIQNLNDDLEIKIRNRTAQLNEAVHKLEGANRELEKSQRLFKAVIHHFPDSVIGVLNRDMRYVFADGQELHSIGLTKNDNRGERVFDNMHPALSREAEQKLRTVFEGQRISYDIEINGKTYAISSVPLPDEGSTINEVIVVIRNITERKKVEKELVKSVEKEKELNDMKSKFVTMASHEFRTPLSTILSSVFLLENYDLSDLEKNKHAHLSKIKRSVNNLTELLNDFISLGKLEEGRIKVIYSEINIRDFLEELVPDMELIRKGNQRILCEYSGDEIEVFLDKQLLRSILLNLISNAIKYSSIDSIIRLEASLTENNLTIKVTDQGIGIPPEEHKHIFKRFYRAHNAANTEGTGLGLNIIKKYVRLMKGTIEFQSKLNEGTTFTVTFPRMKTEDTKQKPINHQTP